MVTNLLKLSLIVAAIFVEIIPLSAKDFLNLQKLPVAYQPKQVGKLVAGRFASTRSHALHMNRWISYPETFLWNGSLRFAQLTKDEKLRDSLVHRFDYLVNQERQYLQPMYHVDMNMFGSLPLLIYQIKGKKGYLLLGLPYAETQWKLPTFATEDQKRWDSQGYSWQTRLWIDDMYMITIVQVEAYNATHDQKYLIRAAREIALYLNKLQRPNGLFYHADDVPFYWGRGNGWAAAGMAELLKVLPRSNEYYSIIMSGFCKMMKALKFFQNKEGLWSQLVDKNDCWTETSCSAMFTFALINGIKQGWLNINEYGPMVRRAWIGLCNYINPDGQVRNVCVGTNKKNSIEYYYQRPRRTGDYHGQAPYMWCVNALLEK